MPSASFDSLSGGGEMDARIRALDWSRTALGPSDQGRAADVSAAGIGPRLSLDEAYRGFLDWIADPRAAPRRREAYARINVRDDGRGIPNDRSQKISERFGCDTRSFCGLGLSLFIVQQIVDAHHGTIRVEREEGRGAMFVVDLALNPPREGVSTDGGIAT